MESQFSNDTNREILSITTDIKIMIDILERVKLKSIKPKSLQSIHQTITFVKNFLITELNEDKEVPYEPGLKKTYHENISFTCTDEKFLIGNEQGLKEINTNEIDDVEYGKNLIQPINNNILSLEILSEMMFNNNLDDVFYHFKKV